MKSFIVQLKRPYFWHPIKSKASLSTMIPKRTLPDIWRMKNFCAKQWLTSTNSLWRNGKKKFHLFTNNTGYYNNYKFEFKVRIL